MIEGFCDLDRDLETRFVWPLLRFPQYVRLSVSEEVLNKILEVVDFVELRL